MKLKKLPKSIIIIIPYQTYVCVHKRNVSERRFFFGAPKTFSGTSFVDHLCFFCLVFVMPFCASVYLCLVVTCWERADLLAEVCGV